LSHRRNSTPNLSCASQPGHAPDATAVPRGTPALGFTWNPVGRSVRVRGVLAGSIGSVGFAVSLMVQH
jgi:hypothetical protein